jgi:hypothetical protein
MQEPEPALQALNNVIAWVEKFLVSEACDWKMSVG